MSGKHRLAAWFQIVVGIAIIGWWAVAAATGGIVELDEGRIDIVFHIAAELVMAALLIGAGVALHRSGRTRTTTLISGLGLGMLLYSTINSPGYFAERGEWWAIGMFAAIAAVAAGTSIGLMKPDISPESEQPRPMAATTVYRRTP
jgi:steroid 5-alpha reductase family enzyme